MTPYYQLCQHDPAQGVWGDCFRTCIGALLDVDPCELPHRHAEISWEDQDDEMNAWLAPRGLRLIHLAVKWPDATASEVCAYLRYTGDGRFLLSGKSPRGFSHIVVADKSGIQHDPQLNGGGLVGPHDTGTWWVTFLGALV